MKHFGKSVKNPVNCVFVCVSGGGSDGQKAGALTVFLTDHKYSLVRGWAETREVQDMQTSLLYI